MEPTLLVGDRILYQNILMVIANIHFHLVPILLINNSFQNHQRGDLVVFKTPADNRTDYIKRLIGMPGDSIQFVDGEILINNNKILRQKIKNKKNY